ncbi:hypothetical protein [Olivibacter sp. XZL3]|uniref:hypothetical protein n=1 Tax=Olivibacter sp. XZL3 TaxID=1735116 RepID=UPI0010668B10|nr:hypothetical protein [Olivibacter sp. XZL3]
MVIDPNDLSEFDNTPDENLLGLSYRDVLALSLFPFAPTSPLKIRTYIPDEVLDKLPFFRLCEELLMVIDRENSLKLTPKGNLPLKFVSELYENGNVPDEAIELGISKSFRESDIISIYAARQVCTLAGLIKKRSNALSLTNRGKKLRSDRSALLALILYAHVWDFDTWQFDAYPDRATGGAGNHIIWYMLLKYGQEERPTLFYADNYLQFFPELIDAFGNVYATPIEQFLGCFETRVFFRFNDWWGFTETKNNRYPEANTTKATSFLSAVLEFVRNVS